MSNWIQETIGGGNNFDIILNNIIDHIEAMFKSGYTVEMIQAYYTDLDSLFEGKSLYFMSIRALEEYCEKHGLEYRLYKCD